MKKKIQIVMYIKIKNKLLIFFYKYQVFDFSLKFRLVLCNWKNFIGISYNNFNYFI